MKSPQSRADELMAGLPPEVKAAMEARATAASELTVEIDMLLRKHAAVMAPHVNNSTKEVFEEMASAVMMAMLALLAQNATEHLTIRLLSTMVLGSFADVTRKLILSQGDDIVPISVNGFDAAAAGLSDAA